VYCTPSDVATLNTARIMGQGNNPTASDVATYIYMVCGEIDAILTTKGYDVPVVTASAPEAAAYLNGVAAKGAYWMQEEASPSSPNLDRAYAAWMAAKAALMDAQTVMDLPKDTTRALPRGPGVTPTPEMSWHNKPFFTRHERF
jgi:hypothetical protein